MDIIVHFLLTDDITLNFLFTWLTAQTGTFSHLNNFFLDTTASKIPHLDLSAAPRVAGLLLLPSNQRPFWSTTKNERPGPNSERYPITLCQLP